MGCAVTVGPPMLAPDFRLPRGPRAFLEERGPSVAGGGTGGRRARPAPRGRAVRAGAGRLERSVRTYRRPERFSAPGSTSRLLCLVTTKLVSLTEKKSPPLPPKCSVVQIVQAASCLKPLLRLNVDFNSVSISVNRYFPF